MNQTNKTLAECAGLDETQTACMGAGDWRALHDRLEARNPPDSDLRMCLAWARTEIHKRCAEYNWVWCERNKQQRLKNEFSKAADTLRRERDAALNGSLLRLGERDAARHERDVFAAELTAMTEVANNLNCLRGSVAPKQWTPEECRAAHVNPKRCDLEVTIGGRTFPVSTSAAVKMRVGPASETRSVKLAGEARSIKLDLDCKFDDWMAVDAPPEMLVKERVAIHIPRGQSECGTYNTPWPDQHQCHLCMTTPCIGNA